MFSPEADQKAVGLPFFGPHCSNVGANGKQELFHALLLILKGDVSFSLGEEFVRHVDQGLSIGNTAFQLTEGIRQRLENHFSTKGQEKPAHLFGELRNGVLILQAFFGSEVDDCFGKQLHLLHLVILLGGFLGLIFPCAFPGGGERRRTLQDGGTTPLADLLVQLMDGGEDVTSSTTHGCGHSKFLTRLADLRHYKESLRLADLFGNLLDTNSDG
mmetsp:Transcript_27095/g.59139  ORF Transcript_27095/g.59139 Transcript_27095/m.59139 type:complete len:215 (+) Transcript_27095:131-775(+)